MDERLRFIKHKDQALLLVDFSQGTKRDLLALLPQVQATITKHPRNSVLVLADFTAAQVDKAVAARMKEVLVFDRAYVKRSAWVGTESLPKVFYEGFKTFSQREFPTFATREEAMEWLVKE
jgi:hypothetical protein